MAYADAYMRWAIMIEPGRICTGGFSSCTVRYLRTWTYRTIEVVESDKARGCGRFGHINHRRLSKSNIVEVEVQSAGVRPLVICPVSGYDRWGPGFFGHGKAQDYSTWIILFSVLCIGSSLSHTSTKPISTSK